MGRCLGIFGIIIGVLVIGVAIVVIILFVTDNDISNDLIANTFCEEDEILIREEYTTTTSDGQGTSINFYCDNNRTGEQRDITDQATLAGVGGFIVNLCCGILLVIGAGSLLSASVARQKIGQYTNFIGQPVNIQQPPDNLQVTFTQDSYTAAEIEERLQKLQQMLNAGTLSQEQYFSIEQELRSRQQF